MYVMYAHDWLLLVMKRNLLLLATLGVLNVLPAFSVANENDQK